MSSEHAAILALEEQLEFLDSGQYYEGWGVPLIFEDSPICRKHPNLSCQGTNCALLAFVPVGERIALVPCRHIRLDDEGRTLDGLYRTATQEQLEATVRAWLIVTISRLREQEGMCA